MIEVVDFSNCKLSSRDLEYGGRAGEKKGIIYKDDFWFLKFPKSTQGMRNVDGLSYVTSPLSEFIGSQIYRILGFDVHETILGICFDGKRYKVVCACKDFICDNKNEMLIPYTSLRNDTSPEVMADEEHSSLSASNLNEIVFQLKNNKILKIIPNAIKRFWDVLVVDMLINNNDRNEDNWGVIKNKALNTYKLAPVYDCGNCFYSKATEQHIQNIMNDREKLISSSLNGRTAYSDNNNKLITVLELFKIKFKDFRDACERVLNLVNQKIDDIEKFLFDIPLQFNDIQITSKLRIEYYLESFRIRIGSLIVFLEKHK